MTDLPTYNDDGTPVEHETVEFHNHARVRVRGESGEYHDVLACRITDEDVNDDGSISYPPSGECTCFAGVATYTDRTPYLDDVLADLHTIRGLMNDGRPLEALSHTNDAISSLEDEIDG